MGKCTGDASSSHASGYEGLPLEVEVKYAVYHEVPGEVGLRWSLEPSHECGHHETNLSA
jgi:hypothetical protein